MKVGLISIKKSGNAFLLVPEGEDIYIDKDNVNGAINDDKVLIEIRNKLNVGDQMELIVPGKIEPVEFQIEKLWNDETLEEIQTVNPGKAEQKVILNKPKTDFVWEKDWILRRKK